MALPAGPDAALEAGADALSRALRAGHFSARELMAETLARIERLNPVFNPIVSQREPQALLAEADVADRALAAARREGRLDSLGWLHGMPQAIKDLAPTAGLVTTLGSPLMRDFVPKEDGLMVARVKAAGAIVIGKTNTPEFGLGSHTFNEVFGATRNAWDPARSAGGSSGGAAVALALRLLAVADGSDFMGSLRNPAGWNHVFGLRPSQGRVPLWPAQDVWVSQLGTEGPMARHVLDLARMLDVMAGWDARVPLSLGAPDAPGPGFADGLDELDPAGLRIGWLADLGGHLAMEPGVLEVCESALRRFEALGSVVEPTALGFAADRMWSCWLVWRRWLVASRIATFVLKPGHRDRIKPEALWEHDQARELTGHDVLAASVDRSTLLQQVLRLFGRFDLLALPSAQVWPFPVGERWPTEIAGRTMDTYHRWMEVVVMPTLAGLPVVSVPAGFHPQEPWPIGLQLIGPPRGDKAVLRAARAYERAAADLLERRPPGIWSNSPSPARGPADG
jgi:amidase